MRTYAFLLLGAALILLVECSNDSGTSGPETLPVELDVRAQAGFCSVSGATVQVQNLSAVTDTYGLAVFHSDINILVPNHTYKITVIAGGLVQTFPDADTIRVPSSPKEPSGYVLFATVHMMPPGE